MANDSEMTTMRMTDARKRRIEKAEEALDEKTRTGAIDKSTEIATHTVSYLEDDLEQELQAIADERTPSRHLDVEVSVDVTVE
jgi:hypothetical protein